MYLIYFFAFLQFIAIILLALKWRSERSLNRKTSFIIDHFSDVLASNKSIEALLLDVANQCMPVLGLEDCVIYLKRGSDDYIQVAAYGPKSKEGKVDSPLVLHSDQGVVGLSIRTGQIQNVKNTSKHSDYIPDDDIRLSELSVPITIDDEVVGVIDSEHSRPGFFKHSHERQFSIIAMLCASKIKEIRTEQDMERKERFEEKYNYLRELDRMKTEFVKSISHDLKSPLTLMGIQLEKLTHDSKDSSSQKTLASLNESFRVFEGVLDQMMELNEIERGNTTTKTKNIDPQFSLKEWTMLYEGQCEKSGLELNITFEDLPELWVTDESKLQRIFMNLLSNAIKFTPEGGRVKVRSHAEGEYLYVSIFNSGNPIPDEHLPHIFEKFYQTNTDNLGSGLGLHICKSMVELLGGDIWVTSYSDGNTFEFRLPSLPESRPEMVDKVPIQLQTDIPVVLIVEDHAELRQTLADSLTSEYQVLTAAEGRAALKLSHRWQPDLVVSDLRMPGMDGLEFVSKLRADARTDHIPVIITSARGTFDDRLELMGHGVDLFFPKPYVMSELKAAMQELLKRNKKNEDEDPHLDAPSRSFLEDLHAFLDDHLSNPELNNSHLEEHFGLGRNALLRKMRSVVGCSPAEYTQQYRLGRAHELLLLADQSVKEIAYFCGFNHPSYFTKAFKKHFGYPPSEVDKAYTGE